MRAPLLDSRFRGNDEELAGRVDFFTYSFAGMTKGNYPINSFVRPFARWRERAQTISLRKSPRALSRRSAGAQIFARLPAAGATGMWRMGAPTAIMKTIAPGRAHGRRRQRLRDAPSRPPKPPAPANGGGAETSFDRIETNGHESRTLAALRRTLRPGSVPGRSRVEEPYRMAREFPHAH